MGDKDGGDLDGGGGSEGAGGGTAEGPESEPVESVETEDGRELGAVASREGEEEECGEDGEEGGGFSTGGRDTSK